ncbi:deoxyribose-phosphate aldolase [Psychrobacillus psychrotolerans]|uniref:deoxyribose-phosphate aldolase n=1 Tax=Psychrobacillus psychrotolerans TaxID=126156 RepID=UPI003B025412
MTIATMIDHTLLKADATNEQIEILCQEAVKYEFATVCVNPHYVSRSAKLLANTKVKVCTVIGFPLGANKTLVKLFEMNQAVQDGAEEIDYVVNISDVKNGDFHSVRMEMEQFLKIKEKYPNLTIKIILEVCYLTNDEISKISLIARECGIDYVKTSTGFGSGGATVESVQIMNELSGDQVKVKASGGIRSAEDAEKYLKIGVSRIGTSNGISIVSGTEATSTY